MTLSDLYQYLGMAVSVVSAADLILAGLRKLAKLTPSPDDDLALTKAQRAVDAIKGFLGRFSLLNNGRR